MKFRRDIQGLRGLAFLLVFIFHLNSSWLPGGFIGVDVFFVISGYLMTSIIISQKNNNQFNTSDFYWKRLKRIFPAYIFLIFVVCIIGAFIYLRRDIWTLQKSGLAAALFVSNLLFSRGNSYFGAQLNENPFLHTWSLSIEMQFYFVLPLLLLYIKNKYLSKIFLVIIIVLTAYSTSVIILKGSSSAYFSILTRIPEFLIGSFYSVIFKQKLNFKRIYNNLFAFISLAILVLSAVIINENSFFPGLIAFIPCIAVSNLLVIQRNFISDFFSQKIAVFLGELSYSLYLFHWPIIAFIRYYNDNYILSVNEIVFTILLTFVLGWISYNFIENYFRRKNNTTFKRFLILSFILSGLLILFLPKISDTNKIPDVYTSPSFGLKSHNQKNIETFGDKKSKYSQILLIGDSHALTIKPFLDYIGKRNDFSFSTITTDGLPALAGIKQNEISRDGLKFYHSSQKLVPFTQKNINNNKIIIIDAITFVEPQSIFESLEKLAKSLKPDQKLVVLNTFPSLNHDPIKINRGFIKNTSKEFKLIYRENNKTTLKKMALKFSNVYFYDLSKSTVFIHAPFYNDSIMYYNRSHLNNYGSVTLAKDLEMDFMSFFEPLKMNALK